MIYALADGVQFLNTGKEAYLLRVMENKRFDVGGAAVDILQLIDGKRDMDQILYELIQIFGTNVEPYVLAKDLERFVFDLLEEGLLKVVGTMFDNMEEEMKGAN